MSKKLELEDSTAHEVINNCKKEGVDFKMFQLDASMDELASLGVPMGGRMKLRNLRLDEMQSVAIGKLLIIYLFVIFISVVNSCRIKW